MQCDSLGIAYPVVDISQCTDCGRCSNVCPFQNIIEPLIHTHCYAAVNRNEEIRLESSSGGVFFELANQIISRGGVVFGATFSKDWNVIHTYAETSDKVLPMIGSKYVQSDTSGTFNQAKHFLNSGREVMYTGTPCQIAGLKHFLNKDYPGLLCVEVICHGVPAPKIWNTYLKELILKSTKDQISSTTGTELNNIIGIKFRSKLTGWKNYGFNLQIVNEGNKTDIYEKYRENQYMTAFLSNYTLRPSCYACKCKAGTSQADITIGDFWGIDKTAITEDDDKGVSCVICRSGKGSNMINNLEGLALTKVGYDDIFRHNPSLEKSVTYTYAAKRFQLKFPRKGFFKTLQIVQHPSIFIRGIYYIKRKLTSLI